MRLSYERFSHWIQCIAWHSMVWCLISEVHNRLAPYINTLGVKTVNNPSLIIMFEFD